MVIKSTNKFVVACVIVFVILISGHAFQTIYPVLQRLVIPAAAVILLLGLAKINRLTVGKMGMAAMVFVGMACFTLVGHFGEGFIFYLTIIGYVLVGYGLARAYGLGQIARAHRSVMTVVTLVAIVGYVLVQGTTVLDSLPQMQNVNDVKYRIGVIFNYIVGIPERNCAMFWEPGLFATHLTIAMVFEIMMEKKPRVWRLLLFSIGIFTANSSAGFALWFLCINLFFAKKINITKKPILGCLSMVVLLAGLAVIVNFDLILDQTGLGDNPFFKKLATENVAESSRMRAITHNLKLFLTAPVFGVGSVEAAKQMAHVADTSTFTYLISIFGILGFSYALYWVYSIYKLRKVNIFAKIIILAIVVIILNKEPHHNLLLSWMLLFALLQEDRVKEKSPQDMEQTRIPERMGCSI